MRKQSKTINEINFKSDCCLTDYQLEILTNLLNRNLTDEEKIEITFDVFAEVSYPDPEVGVFTRDIDNVIVTYQNEDITDVWDKPTYEFDDEVWDAIQKEFEKNEPYEV